MMITAYNTSHLAPVAQGGGAHDYTPSTASEVSAGSTQVEPVVGSEDGPGAVALLAVGADSVDGCVTGAARPPPALLPSRAASCGGSKSEPGPHHTRDG
jgi:hypothetical protein